MDKFRKPFSAIIHVRGLLLTPHRKRLMKYLRIPYYTRAADGSNDIRGQIQIFANSL